MNDIIPPTKPGQELTVSRATSLERPRSGNITTAIQLTSFHDILDFADNASRSGLIPIAYRNKPADIVIAVMHGAELGLPPVQSVNSIAVINGRPSVWGDAVPGLCYGSGLVQDIEEYYEGEPGSDTYTAVCIATRRGFSPKTGKFSQADAKTAGLYGKATHGSYPKRMMMWRARHFALHDAFPDVLRGIGTRELEAEDEISGGPKWSMPQPERAAFSSRPALEASDGWDNTWFEGVQNKLIAEPNAWKWMEILLAAIKDTPTLRDLEEIGDLRNVREARANAPEEARVKIDTAWNAAEARFKAKLDDAYVPGGAKPAAQGDPLKSPAVVEKMIESHDAVRREIAEREKINEDPFDVVLVDQHGEIHGEYNDPRAFALDLMALWQKLHEAEDGKAIDALCDYNADAIDHARSISEPAAVLFAALDEDAAESAVIQIVEPPADRGKPSWTGYVGLIKQALEAMPFNGLTAWAEAQRPTLEKCPMAQRAVAVRAIVEYSKQQATPLPWLGDLIRAAKPKPEKPAAKEAEKPVEKVAEKPAEPVDPDIRWVDERIVELATIDEAGFNELVKSTVVRTVMARLRRDKPTLFERADKEFSDKYNALLAKKGA